MNTPEPFLPDFCSLPAAFFVVMGSLALAFVLTLADASTTGAFWPALGLRGFFIVWIALPSAALLCALRRPLARLDPARAGLAAFGVVEAMTLLVATLAQRGLPELGYPPPLAGPALPRILAISGLVTAAWLRYHYLQLRWQRQARAETLARLEALQARMHPHFLFNSLEAIAGLIGKDPVAAERLLLDLADVYRAILRRNAQPVPLPEELALTRQYLRLEQQRLGSRLTVRWALKHVPADALIPPLSLQPLVENAIRHGVEPSAAGGRVDIGCRLGREGLVVVVRNTLPASGAARPLRRGAREALANLRARLEARFPGQARLTTGLCADSYEARLILPYPTRRHESADR
ncbi:sensor histidine kinase [Candidatus Methylocalor cossyra]|uniref:Two-component system, LytT family, sensor histidine kinase AlgZ n=1 Tax=Candidatus Methylocalor cossyra TaxID=3108543 RepID=A0ABM9NLM6_9GAMM